MSQLEPHQQRVVDEKRELDDKQQKVSQPHHPFSLQRIGFLKLAGHIVGCTVIYQGQSAPAISSKFSFESWMKLAAPSSTTDAR